MKEISCPKCGRSSNLFGVYLGGGKVRCLGFGCGAVYRVRSRMPNIVADVPAGNIFLGEKTKEVLREMKFWIGVDRFDRELARVQVRDFVESFNTEMCRAIRRRTR